MPEVAEEPAAATTELQQPASESPWVSGYNEEGYQYWFNNITGESSWYPPEGFEAAADGQQAAGTTEGGAMGMLEDDGSFLEDDGGFLEDEYGGGDDFGMAAPPPPTTLQPPPTTTAMQPQPEYVDEVAQEFGDSSFPPPQQQQEPASELFGGESDRARRYLEASLPSVPGDGPPSQRVSHEEPTPSSVACSSSQRPTPFSSSQPTPNADGGFFSSSQPASQPRLNRRLNRRQPCRRSLPPSLLHH